MMLLAKFEKVEQTAPGDYRVKWQEKLFDQHTTLLEVRDWVLEQNDSSLFPELILSVPEVYDRGKTSDIVSNLMKE